MQNLLQSMLISTRSHNLEQHCQHPAPGRGGAGGGGGGEGGVWTHSGLWGKKVAPTACGVTMHIGIQTLERDGGRGEGGRSLGWQMQLAASTCTVMMNGHNLKFLSAYCSANKLHMPSQQAGVLVLQRLLGGCRLATQTLPAVHAAAAQLLAQLSMTYFMPFCLTALSMVARVQVLLMGACHKGKGDPPCSPPPPPGTPTCFSRPCPMAALPQASLGTPSSSFIYT